MCRAATIQIIYSIVLLYYSLGCSRAATLVLKAIRRNEFLPGRRVLIYYTWVERDNYGQNAFTNGIYVPSGSWTHDSLILS